MSINSKDISVVVQGAVSFVETKRCLDSIRKCLPDAEIILSTWIGSNVDGLDYDILELSSDPGGVLFYPDGRLNNVNRQIISTKAGLNRVSRKYALKIRTDFYIDYAGFLEYLYKFPKRKPDYCIFDNRVIVSSVYSREFSDQTGIRMYFHPSDFYYFGLSSDLKRLFDSVGFMEAKYIANYQVINSQLVPYYGHTWSYSPEQFIFYSLVKKYYNCYFPDWTYFSNENDTLSYNLMFNNFIFLDYIQSGIFSEKHAFAMVFGSRFYGIINYKRFLDEYRSSWGGEFKEEYVSANYKLPYIRYTQLYGRFILNIKAFYEPFKRLLSYMSLPFRIFLDLSKILFNKYFLRKLLFKKGNSKWDLRKLK